MSDMAIFKTARNNLMGIMMYLAIRDGVCAMYLVTTERGYISTQNGYIEAVQDMDSADQYEDEYDADRLAQVVRLSERFRKIEVIKI